MPPLSRGKSAIRRPFPPRNFVIAKSGVTILSPSTNQSIARATTNKLSIASLKNFNGHWKSCGFD